MIRKIYKEVSIVQSRMILILMRFIVPKVETLVEDIFRVNTNHEDDKKMKNYAEEQEMWSLKLNNIGGNLLKGIKKVCLSSWPVVWLTRITMTVSLLFTSIREMERQTRSNYIKAPSERMQILMWEISWRIVLWITEKGNGTRDSIYKWMRAFVIMFNPREIPIDNVEPETNAQQLQLVLGCETDVEKQQKNEEIADEGLIDYKGFTLSDIDKKMYHLEKEINEYEKTIVELEENITSNIELFVAHNRFKDNDTQEKMDQNFIEEDLQNARNAVGQENNTRTNSDDDQMISDLRSNCNLTDVPDKMIENVDLDKVKFTPTTISSFNQLMDNQILGRFKDPNMFNMLCARRWKSQHLVAWAEGRHCSHFNTQEAKEEMQ